MRALLHVHTSFSYDGDLSPADVAEGARALGAGAVFLSEHLRGLTSAAYGELVREAAELSDGALTLVPGLEVKLPGGGDLLALGVPDILKSGGVERLADEVHEAGGVAVLAHPENAAGIQPSSLLKLDGVEVWNGLHDSKYFPNGAALSFLRRGRALNGKLFGCCGLDLHRREGWFPLALDLDEAAGSPLEALRSGAFTYGRTRLSFSADWVPRFPAMAGLVALTSLHKGLAALLAAAGCSVPRPLSGLLRRGSGEGKKSSMS